MILKVFSWNMYCNNKKFDSALKFLYEHDADVMCLQEVPVEIVRTIKKYPGLYVAEAKAHNRGREKMRTRNIIISKHPMKEKAESSLQEDEHPSIKSRITGLCGPLEFQYVDIKPDDKKIRIFNSHLECNTSPRIRVEQFKQVLRLSRKNSVNIYCGDLNTYGEWYLNLFVGYISNYTLKDITHSERKLFNELFSEYKLNNIFHGEVTYPLFLLQLDHILVPNNIPVISKTVHKKRYGSDHRPIVVELEV